MHIQWLPDSSPQTRGPGDKAITVWYSKRARVCTCNTKKSLKKKRGDMLTITHVSAGLSSCCTTLGGSMVSKISTQKVERIKTHKLPHRPLVHSTRYHRSLRFTLCTQTCTKERVGWPRHVWKRLLFTLHHISKYTWTMYVFTKFNTYADRKTNTPCKCGLLTFSVKDRLSTPRSRPRDGQHLVPRGVRTHSTILRQLYHSLLNFWAFPYEPCTPFSCTLHALGDLLLIMSVIRS